MPRQEHTELPRHRARGLACLLAAMTLTGCATAKPDVEDLTPVLPRSESRLETAPPAARDELAKALGWIADDASKTEIDEPANETRQRGGQR